MVVLDIVAGRISPTDWADVYDETLRMLLVHPARLLGRDWITVAGEAFPAYTRSIERDRDDSTAQRWCVARERATLTKGEPQTMYRDLGRYLARQVGQGAVLALGGGPAPPASLSELDILFDAGAEALSVTSASLDRPLPAHPVPGHAADVSPEVARPGSGLSRVFSGSPGAPCELPLLAAAMVVESRFLRWAMVHGDFGREEAEAARRWAEAVLGRPIALPVRVEAWQLVERLAPRFEGLALVRRIAKFEGVQIAKIAGRDASWSTTGACRGAPVMITKFEGVGSRRSRDAERHGPRRARRGAPAMITKFEGVRIAPVARPPRSLATTACRRRVVTVESGAPRGVPAVAAC